MLKVYLANVSFHVSRGALVDAEWQPPALQFDAVRHSVDWRVYGRHFGNSRRRVTQLAVSGRVRRSQTELGVIEDSSRNRRDFGADLVELRRTVPGWARCRRLYTCVRVRPMQRGFYDRAFGPRPPVHARSVYETTRRHVGVAGKVCASGIYLSRGS